MNLPLRNHYVHYCTYSGIAILDYFTNLLYLCRVKNFFRKSAIGLLLLVTLFANGGIHFIIHRCHHTGSEQIHFATRHGCCSHSDSHVHTQCCGNGHSCAITDSKKSHWQTECCSDEVNYFRTDATDLQRHVEFQPPVVQPAAAFLTFQNYLFTPAENNQAYACQFSHSPPLIPSQAGLCVFRT